MLRLKNEQQTHTPRRVRRGGFTLMEVLIASAVLAFAVATMVTPLAMAAKQQRFENKQTIAITIGTQAIEKCMAMTSAEVLAMNGTVESGTQITDVTGATLDEASLEGYTLSISASEVPLPAGSESVGDAPNFVLATVSVTHADVPDIELSRLFMPQ